jgi:pyruvate/2-oxoglutarate dehydrogenase complex dihydrolipoamide dehydrogenase (E3) component
MPFRAAHGRAEPLTSDTVWDLDTLPTRLAVLGGGPIGCEFAQAFARLGAEVTVIEATDRLVPKEEPDAGIALSAALCADGISVLTSTTVTKAVRHTDGVRLDLTSRDGTGVIDVDRVLVATGRRPRTAGLGLSSAGVRLDDRGYVAVDALLRTSNRRIYAGGDVTGAAQFTHVAGVHGSIAATNALLAPVRRIDHDRIPWVTFTDPEIAHVGLTEDQARRRHGATVRVRLLRHEHVDRAVVEDDTDGFTHVVLDRKGRVLVRPYPLVWGRVVRARWRYEIVSKATAHSQSTGNFRAGRPDERDRSPVRRQGPSRRSQMAAGICPRGTCR